MPAQNRRYRDETRTFGRGPTGRARYYVNQIIEIGVAEKPDDIDDAKKRGRWQEAFTINWRKAVVLSVYPEVAFRYLDDSREYTVRPGMYLRPLETGPNDEGRHV